MKNLYIIKDIIPFPSSEYGDIYTVIAKDDEECIEILKKDLKGYLHDHRVRIPSRVKSATRFTLQDDEPSGLVDSFVT